VIGVQGWKNITDVEGFIERNSMLSGRHFGIYGEDYFFELRCEQDYLKAFNLCPPLKAIIGKRAKAFNSGEIKVVRPGELKKATGAVANSIRALIVKPNPIQTENQFFAQQNHYIDIFGYCPILKIRAAGFPDEISAMWNIPPWLFDIDYTGKLWKQNSINDIYDAYYIQWGADRAVLKKEDVSFIFDDGIGTECDTNLTIPDSRLVSLEYPVSNIIAAYKARNTLITKRGAIGILSNESEDDSGSVPMHPGTKEILQQDFRKHGITGQPYQVIVTDAKLKWQQMGFPTAQLQLFEEIQDSTNQIANAYGYPSGMMSQIQQTTYNNKKTDRRDYVENTIIPESESRMEQFTRAIVPKEENILIIQDYSQVTVLQEDKKAAADARKSLNDALSIEFENNIITRNMWLEKLGEPTVTGKPEFDQYKYEIKKEESPVEEENPFSFNGINGNKQELPATNGRQN
jgi:hypothetical protein